MVSAPVVTRKPKLKLMLAYRTAFVLLDLGAVFYQLSIHVSHGFDVVNFFSYFTNLSNVLGSATFLYLVLRWARPRGPLTELFRSGVVTSLALVGITYWTLLVNEDLGTLDPTVNFIVHGIMPLAIAIDWLFDPPQHRLSLRRAALWLLYPIVYVGYSLARGPFANFYPYPFLNPTNSGGYAMVAGFSVILAAIFLIVLALFIWLGNRLGRSTLQAKV